MKNRKHTAQHLLAYVIIQIPQNIDPNAGEEVALWESPENIAIVGLLLFFIVGYYVYRRRRLRKKLNDSEE